MCCEVSRYWRGDGRNGRVKNACKGGLGESVAECGAEGCAGKGDEKEDGDEEEGYG